MTKRILATVLCLLVLAMSAVFVSAAAPTTYIVDELAYLYSDEVEMLNEEAAGLHSQYGVGVFFVYTMSETLADYDIGLIVEDTSDYVVMMENEDSWYMHLGGRAEDIITEDMRYTLRDRYDEEATFRAGVSVFLSETAKLFAFVPSEPTNAVNTTGGEAEQSQSQSKRLYDGADLLSDAEETEIINKLDNVSETHHVDMAIVTLDGIEEGTIDQYIHQYFDNSTLGYGAQRDAVLFMIDMASRQFRILSNGAELGAAAISMDDINAITDDITSDLSAGNYAAAFTAFIDECDYQINGYLYGFPFDYTKNLLICVGIGLVFGWIVTGSMKSKLKSVKSQSAAANYVKPDSMSIITSRDTFLYTHVTRTRKESKDSNNSGSSSRNVGGGSF